jgi:lipopolysaccharide transport system ATP-binding protein
MSDIAIKVENLGKMYRIGEKQERYSSFRDTLNNIITAPFRRLRNIGKPAKPEELIWALKDVSFEVKHGEVIGIIGRNGSGKSTLLKILSQITEPTEGQATVYGRVGSLLEVGTGFHPELTGRENIFLNGAILGMSKAEINRKFDEIVDFAEIEKFIDTQVKHYSSGMYMRLAFAVAAHLEPEILLVDEVLAVGDAAFQKKCLGKMGDVAKEGRTVLFVSHNMSAILQLCKSAILLQAGFIYANGTAQDVVDNYIASGIKTEAEVSWSFDKAPGNETTKIKSVRILDKNNEVSSNHYISDPIIIEMDFWCLSSGARLNPSFHVFNIHNVCIFGTANLDDPVWGMKQYEPGLYRSQFIIPGCLLNNGNYYISAYVTKDHAVMVEKKEIVSFQVHDDGTRRGDYTGGWIGVTRPSLPWNIEFLGDITS